MLISSKFFFLSFMFLLNTVHAEMYSSKKNRRPNQNAEIRYTVVNGDRESQFFIQKLDSDYMMRFENNNNVKKTVQLSKKDYDFIKLKTNSFKDPSHQRHQCPRNYITVSSESKPEVLKCMNQKSKEITELKNLVNFFSLFI